MTPKKPTEQDKKISIRLPAELLKKLQKTARDEERSVAAQIRLIIKDWYDTSGN